MFECEICLDHRFLLRNFISYYGTNLISLRQGPIADGRQDADDLLRADCLGSPKIADIESILCLSVRGSGQPVALVAFRLTDKVGRTGGCGGRGTIARTVRRKGREGFAETVFGNFVPLDPDREGSL